MKVRGATTWARLAVNIQSVNHIAGRRRARAVEAVELATLVVRPALVDANPDERHAEAGADAVGDPLGADLHFGDLARREDFHELGHRLD